MQKIPLKKFFRFACYELVLIASAVILINLYVLSFSVSEYFSHIDDIPKSDVGLVLGASVKPDGTPSDILRDRLSTAAAFYHKGKIDSILVSGDNSTQHYNEPSAMQQYLISQGIPKSHIYLDYAGFDTYDSLYRARDIFGSENVTIFTQGFHLHRAIYIGKRFNMQVMGVTTDLQPYLGARRNTIREIFARVKAFIEVEITRPKPTYLGDPVEIVSPEQVSATKRDILAQ